MHKSFFKEERIESPEHLAFVRTLPCMIHEKKKLTQHSRTEAHHLLLTEHKGMACKSWDSESVPMSKKYHDLLHNAGLKSLKEDKFYAKHGFKDYQKDVLGFAAHLWDISPANPINKDGEDE